MLLCCDRCGEIQPNEPWRCRRCRAMMPHWRQLLRCLVGLAGLLGLALLTLVLASVLR